MFRYHLFSWPFFRRIIEYNLLCIIIEKYSENVHTDITLRIFFSSKQILNVVEKLNFESYMYLGEGHKIRVGPAVSMETNRAKKILRIVYTTRKKHRMK